MEVFGGGMSVLFAKQKSKLESVNDINSGLINLFKIIRDKPESLSYVLEQMLISREVFEDIKTKKDAPSNDIKRAAYFYYLISQSFGSKGTHFAMNAKSGRKPKNLWRNFMTWSKRLHFVTIENLSFEELIKRYDKEDTFFYLDPPYYNYEKVYTS